MDDVYNVRQMWGALALRGVLAILFGITAVFWPGMTIVTLVYLFGAYILASGLINEIVGLANLGGPGRSGWGRVGLMLLGVAEIGVGIYLLRHPLVTFATFILLMGLSLIVRGVFEIIAGIFGESGGTYRTVLVISGLLAALAGIVLLMQPVSGGVAFVWILGLYALITGPMLVAMAFEAKNATESPSRSRAARS